MRAVIQRCSRARVTVDGTVTGEIAVGLLVLLGIHHDDTVELAERFAAKTAALRVFEDGEGKMNVDVRQAGGAVLAVSQFTLYGDVRRGNRPSFAEAARPEVAEPVYEAYCRAVEAAGVRCERGVFGAHMEVELVNDGPVTVVVDSVELERPRD